MSAVAALSAFGSGDYTAAATAFQSFARADYGNAELRATDGALDSAVLGNSAEQRDVLDEVYMLCLLLSGQHAAAAHISFIRATVRVRGSDRAMS